MNMRDVTIVVVPPQREVVDHFKGQRQTLLFSATSECATAWFCLCVFTAFSHCRQLVLSLPFAAFPLCECAIFSAFPSPTNAALAIAVPKKIEKFAKSMLIQPIIVNVGRAGVPSLPVISLDELKRGRGDEMIHLLFLYTPLFPWQPCSCPADDDDSAGDGVCIIIENLTDRHWELARVFYGCCQTRPLSSLRCRCREP